MEAPGIHLQRIATIFSRLSPFFSNIRQQSDFAHNTLLPNALSPIAPAMAYGFCGKLDHGSARGRLEQYQIWKEACAAIEEEYNSYKSRSDNALLWAGWNYWDPTEDEGSDRRVIQVVLTEDLLEAKPDLLNPERVLLGAGAEEPLLKVGQLLGVPQPDAPKEVPLGKNLSNDAEFLSEELIKARRYLYNIWHDIFLPSIKYFNRQDQPTIVDLMFEEHRLYRNAVVDPIAQDFAAFFQGDGAFQSGCGDIEDVRTFECEAGWSERLWELVARRWKEQLKANRLSDLPESGTDYLLNAWKEQAKSSRSLSENLERPTRMLTNALGPHLAASPRAYVVLQHLALFDRFLLSPNQYVFPVAFGDHVFVAFLAMKRPMSQDEVAGWRQVTSSLFGSLLVELLTRLTEGARLRDKLQKSLAHSLPKAVFKPLEFMALGLGEKRGAGLESARASMVFLARRGQSVLSDYVAMDGEGPRVSPLSTSSGASDLREILRDLRRDSQSGSGVFNGLRDIALAGLVDPHVKRSVWKKKSAPSFREELLDGWGESGNAIELRVGVPEDELVVPGRKALWSLHIWNILENALRHIDLGAAFRSRSEWLEEVLVIKIGAVEVGDDVELTISNTGEAIPRERLELLNQLFMTEPDSPEASIARERLRSAEDSELPVVGMQSESLGRGLAGFVEFLHDVWESVDKPQKSVGEVTSTPELTIFRVRLPRVSMRGRK